MAFYYSYPFSYGGRNSMNMPQTGIAPVTQPTAPSFNIPLPQEPVETPTTNVPMQPMAPAVPANPMIPNMQGIPMVPNMPMMSNNPYMPSMPNNLYMPNMQQMPVCPYMAPQMMPGMYDMGDMNNMYNMDGIGDMEEPTETEDLGDRPPVSDPPPVLSNNPAVANITLFKELTGYPNYGNPSGNADILYTGNRGVWTFEAPAFFTVPGNLRAQIVIRAVLDDHSNVPVNRYSARITVNGNVVHTGRVNLEHGVPAGSRFTNWRLLTFSISNLRRNNRVVIQNTSDTGSNDWIAFDWMELRLIPR